jgi:hypothetical protein
MSGGATGKVLNGYPVKTCTGHIGRRLDAYDEATLTLTGKPRTRTPGCTRTPTYLKRCPGGDQAATGPKEYEATSSRPTVGEQGTGSGLI